MKSTRKDKISYEPEADILPLEIGGKNIDYAKEIGNLVVHFSKNDKPVLIEILNASKFLGKAKRLIAQNS
jgi:uncharacterized protein YuzE